MNRTVKFIIVGLTLTVVQYLVYLFFALVIFNNNDILWLSSGISYVIATILAYILHSRITWKERKPTNFGIAMFFVWNILTSFLIAPFFTWFFGLAKPTYNFLYSLSFSMSLDFTYEFIESTTIFILVTIVTLILNYLFYDKLVFGDKAKAKKTPAKTTIKSSPVKSIAKTKSTKKPTKSKAKK